MFSAELSSDLQHTIDAVTGGFEDNLKRAFKNEGVRRQNYEIYHIPQPIDDVLFTVNDNIIELRNLSLPRLPDFRINDLKADFKMLNLDLDVNVGDLRVEGCYEVNSKVLQKFLPISHNGKIITTFRNVSAKGRVGLYVRGDSFVPENYDVEYKPSEVSVHVCYHDGSAEIDNEIVESDVESTLAKTFWSQLSEILTNLLNRQLGAVIVEVSVTELLVDKGKELKEHGRQQAIKANRLLDCILCTAKTEIVGQNSRTILTPPLSTIFKGNTLGQLHGKFETELGYLEDLSTLTRKDDMSIYEDDQKIIVYGRISLREFKHGYEKYVGQYMKTKTEGGIKVTIYQNRIFLRFIMLKEDDECTTHLDTVQVSSIKEADLDVSGLGALSWLNDRIRSWVVGHLRNQGLKVLELQIAAAFDHAIRNTDCIGCISA